MSTKKKLKILIITIGKYPHIGGKSTHIDTLLRLLPNEGIYPEVLSLSAISPLKQRIAYFPRTFRNLSLDFSLRRYFLKKELNKKYPQSEYPVVLIQDSPAYLLAQNRPFIFTLHGSACDEYVSQKTITKANKSYSILLNEEKEAAQKASFVITVDSNLKKQIMERSGITENKVVALPNTVDTSVFSPVEDKDKRAIRKELGLPEEANICLVLRRLVPKNGVKFAIEALSLLNRPEAMLIIAGDGPERTLLEDLVEKLNLKEKVCFLGSVEHSRVPQLLQAADLSLVPSVPDFGVVEATSIGALEAMASALPVIASDIGGLTELLSPDAGILVPPKDPKAIKDAWESLLNDKELALEYSKRARLKVETDFSPQKWAKTYANLINLTLKGED